MWELLKLLGLVQIDWLHFSLWDGYERLGGQGWIVIV
jgi:hypothetical protein